MITNWYQTLKSKNFGLESNDLADLEDIIGPPRKFQPEMHAKIVNFLLALDKLNVNTAEKLKNETINIRKELRFHPSRSKLSKVYFQDFMWPEWANSSFQINKNISQNLMNAFLDSNSVQGSYGTVNVTIITPPLKSCQYKCTYCPHGPTTGALKAPISYLPNEPAVARGSRVNYNIIAQIRTRIKDLALSGVVHREYNNGWKTMCKADIRLAGGTFNSYPRADQDEFIRRVYYAVRTIDYLDSEMPEIMSLEDEIEFHTTNPNLGVLIVGLSIETRPDEINLETIERFNKYHLTWIELGVQSTHDSVLKMVKRGHKVYHSKLAIAMLKSLMGAKILGHIMPNLPGSSPEMDKQVFEDKIIRKHTWLIPIIVGLWAVVCYLYNSTFCLSLAVIHLTICWIFLKDYKIKYALPHLFDHIKIYPTMILPHTNLHKYTSEQWRNYSEENNGDILMEVVCHIVSNLPPWVRIARLIRDFHPATKKNKGMGYTSNTLKANMAQLVTERLTRDYPICNEIKSREVRNSQVNLDKIHFKIHSYECSTEFPEYAGTEYFGSLEAPADDSVDRLIGLFRLRLNYRGGTALLRELHVYGGYIPKGTNPDNNSKVVQHRGYGKQLIRRAEMIAYLNGFSTMSVISAPGTVFYYKKRGYAKVGRYMVKELTWYKFNINDLMNFVISMLFS